MIELPRVINVGSTPFHVEFLGGKDLSDEEREQIARMIKDGKAVRGSLPTITERVRNAHIFAIARWDANTIAGVAALKAPEASYRRTLLAETKIELTEIEFPAELGYVVVAEKFRGPGAKGERLSSELMRVVMMTKAGKDGVFSTTKISGLRDIALPALGFTHRASYKNEDDENVYLLTKAKTADT